MDKLKMFDYWAFHKDGSVQFFQICEGKIIDYQEYSDVKDAPVVLFNDQLRYHGQSYFKPNLAEIQTRSN